MGCGLVLAVVLGIAIWCFWALARTGWVDLPVLSMGYRTPEPDHVVLQVPKHADVALPDPVRTSSGEQEFFLSEGVLTSALREALAAPAFQDLDGSRAQVAVVGSQLELFAPHATKPTAFRVYVVPEMRDGELSFDLARVVVGQFALPSILVRNLGTRLLSVGISALTEEAFSAFRVMDVELVQEGVRVRINSSPL